jgi:hypothetical protein
VFSQRVCYRSKKIPATAAATSTIAPTTYLFRDSHDCEGSSPALNTKAGAEVSTALVVGTGAASGTGGVAGVETAGATAPLDSFTTTGDDAGVTTFETTSDALGPAVTGVAVVADAAAFRRATGAETGSGTGSTTTGRATFGAAPAAGRGVLNCPRHFFSSHSTHSARPAETGKPQASHFFKFLRIGGTWL